MTKVLVAYGSTRGATAGIAEWIGDTLRQCGLQVDVRPAGSVDNVTPYDAVVLGGAIYAARWHKDARRFVKRHAKALRGTPVWLFSSGPLDRSADAAEIPPVRHALKASVALAAQGHRTFGGCLSADAQGFIVSAVARNSGGDYRDQDHVRGWAREIAADLATPSLI